MIYLMKDYAVRGFWKKSEKRATLITVVDIIQSPNLPLWVVTCAPNSSKMTSVPL